MSIKDDLRRRLRHFGLEKAYDASVICKAAAEVCKGEFEPVSFKNGMLKVTVRSAGKGQLLKIRQDEVIAKINEELGEKRVKRILVKVIE